jgi:hypothetical protein
MNEMLKITKTKENNTQSTLELGDSFVLSFHNVDKLEFTDHAIQLELRILFKKMLFFVFYCNSSQTLNQVVVWNFIISLFLKEIVRVEHLLKVSLLEIRAFALDLLQYFSHSLLHTLRLSFDELGHHFLHSKRCTLKI